MTHSLYWFTNDLRLSDNALITLAAKQDTALSLVYCVDPQWFKNNRHDCQAMGLHRWQFLVQSLQQLNNTLKDYGQHLVIYHQAAAEVIAHYYHHHNVRTLYCSEQIGYDERQTLLDVAKNHGDLVIKQANTFTLYDNQQLPFAVNELPTTFSQFRKLIEQTAPVINSLLDPPEYIARPLLAAMPWPTTLPNVSKERALFAGGEQSATKHLVNYFASASPSTYKETRNALAGYENSSKFSPWLANGCISARQIVNALRNYERIHGANDSTYWIYFELLWREYFQLYSLCYGNKLFSFAGITKRKPLTSFYPQRFKQWCTGTTPYPIVNACMKQLNQTGYMSNRGRQLVASCLVNELKLDWRFGAAYFEQQLIDYDVASNWGNWQYLAGVGADPRSGRHFNLVKQTQTYDANNEFINYWQGDEVHAIDSLDAADWPLSS
ncbi:MAG TPA: DASH family cryptochrome [Pseudoalteromonas prydzensis]|uniref:Cryptochrome DASH n=1 Tax=Pseudoalteromonas prydzensis TaxID=182141 RepID=A0A7V1CYY6_9GAMM|nr:DASH family cryptochrome [Pseudoalteromonas prydzensis]HEA16765.1 DASH family cryptochrome [Pseudoalteromonas prydzensis]